MTDLTPVFKEFVEVFDENSNRNNITSRKAKDSNVSQIEGIELKDSFIKECYSLLCFMGQLKKVLDSIKGEYSAENDVNMSEDDKDEFDTEFRLQFQQYVQKFKTLEKYETERQDLITKRIINPSQGMMSKLTMHNSNKDVVVEFHKTNNKFRTGILQSLNIAIGSVSSEFADMQQERLTQQRKFDLFDLNTGLDLNDTPLQSNDDMARTTGSDAQNFNRMGTPSDDAIEEPLSITVSHGPVEDVHQEVKQYEETMSKLTQEQIQLLETEHEELLNEKNEQLKAVEKINKTILDIVSIQSELSTHLQAQSQNINTMLDNQEEVDINIRKGNKQLKKAKDSASRTANLTKYLAVIIGILILLLDYIS